MSDWPIDSNVAECEIHWHGFSDTTTLSETTNQFFNVEKYLWLLNISPLYNYISLQSHIFSIYVHWNTTLEHILLEASMKNQPSSFKSNIGKSCKHVKQCHSSH